jgi:hypothetical protein
MIQDAVVVSRSLSPSLHANNEWSSIHGRTHAHHITHNYFGAQFTILKFKTNGQTGVTLLTIVSLLLCPAVDAWVKRSNWVCCPRHMPFHEVISTRREHLVTLGAMQMCDLRLMRHAITWCPDILLEVLFQPSEPWTVVSLLNLPNVTQAWRN